MKSIGYINFIIYLHIMGIAPTICEYETLVWHVLFSVIFPIILPRLFYSEFSVLLHFSVAWDYCFNVKLPDELLLPQDAVLMASFPFWHNTIHVRRFCGEFHLKHFPHHQRSNRHSWNLDFRGRKKYTTSRKGKLSFGSFKAVFVKNAKHLLIISCQF